MDSISLKIKELKDPGEIRDYLNRPEAETSGALEAASVILESVKKDGDPALIDFIRKYDGYDAEVGNIRVGKDEISDAAKKVKTKFPGLVDALAVSRKNIESFHMSQHRLGESSWMTEDVSGRKVGQKVTPLERVGLYIPGGRYAYPSTLLMTAIPAITAGVGEIAVCSPPHKDGTLNPVMLYICRDLGIEEIYKIGGAQAVAAMAFGTDTVKKVDKIAGPGNIFVTLAKKLVFGTVGIDSLAGPSDITIIADNGANAVHIAIDMLSQAEHDPLSRSILLSTSRDLAEKTAGAINGILDSYRGREEYSGNLEVMQASIKDFCSIFYASEMDILIGASNIISPEHLEIMVEDSEYVLDGIKNAGAIFIGDNTPVAVGDYIGGTNHVIPTEGNARFSSPLGVGDFLKRSSICSYSREALESEEKHIMELAGFERLFAHRDSVRERFKK